MSNTGNRAQEYRAAADALEARASTSTVAKMEFLYLAHQYRRLAEQVEANFRIPEPPVANPDDGLQGTA